MEENFEKGFDSLQCPQIKRKCYSPPPSALISFHNKLQQKKTSMYQVQAQAQGAYYAYAPSSTANVSQVQTQTVAGQTYYTANQAVQFNQQGYMIAGQNAAVSQQQQQEQLAAAQSPQTCELYGYATAQQLAAVGISLNGLVMTLQSAAGQHIDLSSLPVYQVINYRLQEAVPAHLDHVASLDVPRSRIMNLRHHPYQRN